jgi:beta-glucosidase/6-phospho-beta-glucosidase/beta-galactosidase
VITHQYFDRYRLPVMHTETNIQEPDAVSWLYKEWANVHRLRQDGVPIVGFTWYSLTDQVDWDTGLRENNGRVNTLGLAGLDRNLRPVGKAYQKLVRQWREILPTQSTVLDICDDPGAPGAAAGDGAPEAR